MKSKISNLKLVGTCCVASLILSLAFPALCQITNIYNATNFFGGANNRSVTVSLASHGLGYNGFAVPYTTHTYQPTNGTITFTLLPLNYVVSIDGIDRDFPANETGLTNGSTVNLYDIINATLAQEYTPPLTTIAAGTNLTFTSNYVGGRLVVTISDTNANGGNPQNITVSGDASGSGTTAIPLTLATVATPGTSTKVTYDAKGRITSGTTLGASDIPNLDGSKITTGTVPAATIANGVSAAAALPAAQITGFIQPANISLTNAGLSQSAQYLRIVPMTEFNAPSTPTFGFKWSPDGSSFNYLKYTNSWSDGTNGVYAPSLLYFNNHWLVTTDMGANTGPSNTFTITSSTDLTNWTAATHITLTLSPGGNIYGQSWFVDNGQPYLFFGVQNGAGNPGTSLYVTHPTDLSDAPFTSWTAPTKILTIAAHAIWDPSVFKLNGTYFVAFTDTGLQQIHLWTNTVAPDSTYSQYQANITSGFPGTEGCNFCQLTNGKIRLYLMATTPNNIGKCYFTDTSDMVTWTAPQEIIEQAPFSDHGTTVPLTASIQQNQVNSLANQASFQSTDFQQRWDIIGTNGLAITPLVFPSGGTFNVVRYTVAGMELAQFSTVSEAHPFSFEIDVPVVGMGPLAGVTNYGSPRVKWIQRCFNQFNFGVLCADGGIALKLYSGSDAPVLRYSVTCKVFSENFPLLSGAATAWDLADLPPVDEGLINLSTNGLAAIVNTIIIQPPTDFGDNFDNPATPTLRLTNNTLIFNNANFITTGTGSPAGVLTAPVGSMYLRTDGGANTTLYIKESGTGNTGWVAK